MSIEKTEVPDWVLEIFAHCKKTYIGKQGVFVTAISPNGETVKNKPMLADYGDLLPFAWHFGVRDIIDDQIISARKYLEKGLFKYNGKTELFYNHDWLLGLLDIYRQTNSSSVLQLAVIGANEIGTKFFCGDFLADQRPNISNLYGILVGASPFNGGYIELWVELYSYTKEQKYLVYAEKLANAWISHKDFLRSGIFPRKRCASLCLFDNFSRYYSKLKSRLFKDNTNLIWGILELYKLKNEKKWERAIIHWLDGFEKTFFNNGNVTLMVDHNDVPYNSSVKAAFSSIDLICDIANENIEKSRCMFIAEKIADFWLEAQWENGLFPENPNGSYDHLDANVDLVVALNKLTALTGSSKYILAANKCSESLLKYHYTNLGYCLSVDKHGNVVNSEIRIKYQGLMTKLALLPSDPVEIYKNQNIFDLLRDR